MSATNPGIVLVKTVNAGSYTEKEVTLGAVSLQEPSAIAITGGAITGLTNLDVYNATAAATIRQNLGLEIGVDVQAAGGGGGPIALNTGDITHNDGEITTNDGAITTNNGAVTTQAGAITTNNGAITTQAGAVTTQSGAVTTVATGAVITNVNTGAVITNVNTGAVISNVASGATISTVASGATISAVAGNLSGTIGGNVSGAISGNVSGAIAGDVTGTVAGHVLSVPAQLNDGTPIKATAAHGHVTIAGSVIDGETVTIGTEVFEFDVDGVFTGTQVDCSGHTAAPATAVLTISDNATNDVIDGETVTIDGEVYEFDWNSAVTGGNTAVDISAKASCVKAVGLITVTAQPLDTETLTVGTQEYTFSTGGTTGDHTIDLQATTCPTMARAHAHLELTGLDLLAAVGTATVTAQPVNADTITIDGNPYVFSTDGTTGAAIIDLQHSTCATMNAATGSIAFLAIPINGELITINARTYSFDDAAKTGDVKVDRTACTTIDLTCTLLAAAIEGDGSAVVHAVADTGADTVIVTAKLSGTVGNYAVSDTLTDGGWMPGTLTAGNLKGGTAATAEEVVDRIVAIITAETNVTVSKGSASTVLFTAKRLGVAGNAIVFTELATGVALTGANTLGGVGATQVGTDYDATSFTINGRKYALDYNGGGAGGNVDIACTNLTDLALVQAAIVAGVNADGSAIVTLGDFALNSCLVSSKKYGVIGNGYTLAEDLASGAWTTDNAGFLDGGVAATVQEVVDRIIAKVHETSVVLTDDTGGLIHVTAANFGTAGNAIGLAEVATGIAVDGASLGTHVLGCDCSKEDAAAAFVAEYNTHTAKHITASNIDGVITITAHVAGTAMNGKVTSTTMGNGAWGGNMAGGGDIPKGEAKTHLLALTPSANVDITDGGGDIIDVTCKTKGVSGNLIALAKSGANITVTGLADGKLSGGLDGTVAAKGVCYWDASFIYIASDVCTATVDNWRKATLNVL